MNTPIIDPEIKREFPDEILDEILKATDEFVGKIPTSVLALIPEDNRVNFVSTLAHTMVIGANIALEYINERKATTDGPIINPATLTDEQREAIKDKYKKAPNPYDHQFNVGVGEGWLEAFEWLFGSDLFKKGE